MRNSQLVPKFFLNFFPHLTIELRRLISYYCSFENSDANYKEKMTALFRFQTSPAKHLAVEVYFSNFQALSHLKRVDLAPKSYEDQWQSFQNNIPFD